MFFRAEFVFCSLGAALTNKTIKIVLMPYIPLLKMQLTTKKATNCLLILQG